MAGNKQTSPSTAFFPAKMRFFVRNSEFLTKSVDLAFGIRYILEIEKWFGKLVIMSVVGELLCRTG
jgi:hypothetical protein